MRCDAMRCDAMRCDAMRCDAMPMRCDAMQALAKQREREKGEEDARRMRESVAQYNAEVWSLWH
jgi:hypothetical protein